MLQPYDIADKREDFAMLANSIKIKGRCYLSIFFNISGGYICIYFFSK